MRGNKVVLSNIRSPERRQLARKGRKAAKNFSGTSRWGICPQSGTTTRVARGMS
jgi:hypothetical protein